MSDTNIPEGTPDFNNAVKGTRHGRTKVTKREFDDLLKRVDELEKKAKAPAKKAPAKKK